MKYKFLAAPLALTFALGACDDMLREEPVSFITTATYYKTVDDLEKGMLAGWGSLRAVFPGSFNGITGFMGNMSDQERADPNEVNSPRNVAGLDWTGENMQGLDVAWQNLFRVIYRENIVIDRAATATGDPTRNAQIVAEAKFMRGYSYMWLDRMHSAGNKLTDASVPLILSEEAHTNQEVARATSAEVHAAAIKDLTEAEAALPTRTQRGTAGRGRITKGAAQMALADLYLWRASFMGQSADWAKVAEWTQKVIDSGQYSLVTTGFFNIHNPSTKAANNENIFFMVATGAPGRQNSAYINAYGPRALAFNVGGGFGVNQATSWVINSFAPGDIRGRVGAVPVVGTRQEDTVAYRNYGCSTGKVTGFTDAGGTCGPVTTMPYRFRARPLQAGDGDVDVTHYRYAETLLMNAEAKAQMGDAAGAIAMVNQVRARARRGATGTDTRAEPRNLAAVAGEALIDSIFMDRSRELAHEGKRWNDMVRHDSQHPGYWTEALLHDPQSTSIVPNAPQQLFKKRLPVPQREIDLNKALTQNPGY